MKPLLALVALLLAVPASAQSHVYTAADLGKPIVWTHGPTPEEWRSLVAHQFVAVPEYNGPIITIMNSSSAFDGPWTPIVHEAPWISQTYLGRSAFGGRRRAGAFRAGPSFTPDAPPAIVHRAPPTTQRRR